MTYNEYTWDKLLQINTIGRDDTNSDEYRYPYEPTPYCVLERVADSGLICTGDTVLDYGCGKGRVGFFLSYCTKSDTVGIEYDERIFRTALENKATADPQTKTEFIFGCAEEYEVPTQVNRCYFFNPFSVEILRGVVARILDSYYASPREILLLFYYPSDEYVGYLMTVEELEFFDEIECGDLFGGDNERERILIFELPGYVAE